ncbi:hypothetical protein GQ53DRAFT_818146 [Thozetella sp. PMI_491]|nr:hypothetical protein GQ53DRAFT_818146 [Thozetella sp. PMI_491]
MADNVLDTAPIAATTTEDGDDPASAAAMLAVIECKLCLWVARNPFTTQCGHTFCRRCLEVNYEAVTILRWPFKCKTCSTVITELTVGPALGPAPIAIPAATAPVDSSDAAASMLVALATPVPAAFGLTAEPGALRDDSESNRVNSQSKSHEALCTGLHRLELGDKEPDILPQLGETEAELCMDVFGLSIDDKQPSSPP